MKEAMFYEGIFYYLSNFAACEIECNGHTWPTAEHAYQAQKFPTSKLVQRYIRQARSPYEAKQLACMYAQHTRPDWTEVKLGIMEKILHAKIAQHAFIRDGLLSTGDADIVENSPCDAYWGCGSDGKGENHLGKIWMKLRNDLVECKEEQILLARYA